MSARLVWPVLGAAVGLGMILLGAGSLASSRTHSLGRFEVVMLACGALELAISVAAYIRRWKAQAGL